MIVVSPPIDAQSPIQTNGNIENSSGDLPLIWGNKAQKKNKLGIFAKLLEGLSAKVSVSGEKLSLSPENQGKNVIKTASNEKIAKASRNFNENSEFNNYFAIFDPELLDTELNQDPLFGILQSSSGKKQGKLAQNNTDYLNPGKNLQKTMILNEETIQNHSLRLLMPQLEEGESPFLHNLLSRGEGKPKGIEGLKTGDSENPISFSFREMEAELIQSQLNIAVGQGENDNSRLVESRGRKAKDRPNIEVRDLRSGESGKAVDIDSQKTSGDTLAFIKHENNEIELPVYLSRAEGQAGKSTGNTAGSFEDALARELRGDLSGDIVRDATIIVRNGGEGTIRLSLRPASLGDVKIRLEMTENKITGHIFVESSEALRAFERELPVLEKAFKDSGFSETNLELSLSQDGGQYGRGQYADGGDFASYSPFQAAALYEVESDWIISSDSHIQNEMVSLKRERSQVNLLI